MVLTMKRMGALLGCAVFGGSMGCQRGESIESVPVAEIEVSVPPVEVQDEPNVGLYDDNGVRLVDETRIYGVVAPLGRLEISHSDRDTRFYTERMDHAQVEAFIKKYFPYQPYAYSEAFSMFEVKPWIKDEYKNGAIVPDLSLNVFKPEPPVYLRITYDKARQMFLWVYRDPEYGAREAAPCPNCGTNGANAVEDVYTADQLAKICLLCRDKEGESVQEACQTCRDNIPKMSPEEIQKYDLRAE